MTKTATDAVPNGHRPLVADDLSITTAPNKYQLTLQGLALPLFVHLAFNACAALTFLLIGHPGVAVAFLVVPSAFDAFQQALIRRWIRDSANIDMERGLWKLAALCAARVSIYIAPATFLAVTEGKAAELAFFGLHFASFLVLGMGAGSLSKKIFWSFCTPLIIAAVVVGLLLFPPLVSAGLTLALVALLTVMVIISQATNDAVVSWHTAFLANLDLVQDLAAARDQAIAERRRADEASQAAQHATRAKSNFLATMSHEIRTPMNGVLGVAQLLKRDELDPSQIKRLDVLIDSGEYLLSILNDILDVSKIDAGRLEIAPTPEAVRPFLEGVVGFWAARAEEQGLQLTLDVADGTPETLKFDAHRLRQVLFNLIGNALKFTTKGAVSITVGAVSVGEGAAMVRISVSDTGPGIAERHMERLFDRFSQADESEGRRFGGTGLGLAIVRQLLDLMGGRVWAESRLGEGSTFHVEAEFAIAATVAQAREDDIADAPLALPEFLRVLAVDDNAVNLLVLEQLLASLGYDVARAAGGAEALAALAAERFDLVLSDIQMPEMTGTELLERLRATGGPNAATPVIALTADVTSGGRQSYLALGFNEHCAKPIQLQALLEAIARALAAATTTKTQAA